MRISHYICISKLQKKELASLKKQGGYRSTLYMSNRYI